MYPAYFGDADELCDTFIMQGDLKFGEGATPGLPEFFVLIFLAPGVKSSQVKY